MSYLGDAMQRAKTDREVTFATPEESKKWTNVTLGTSAANVLRLAAKGANPGKAMMPAFAMMSVNPQTSARQTRKDKAYLANARNYDAMEQPFSFKKISSVVESSPQRRKATLLDADVKVSLRYTEKTSSGPNQAAAEAAYRSRPASMGGPGLFQRISDSLKSVVEAGRVPIMEDGRPDRRSIQWAARRAGLLVPAGLLAGGALSAGDAISDGVKNRYNEGRLNKRFENARTHAISSLDAQNKARQILETEDEQGRLREEFAALNKYAPDVAKDPRLAAGFLERMAAAPMGQELSEHVADVNSFVNLQSSIDRNRGGLVSGVGSLAANLI